VRDPKLGAGSRCTLKERPSMRDEVPGARLPPHARKVSPIMPPFLRLHAIAVPRGDGLRPELLALLQRDEVAVPTPHFLTVAEQDVVDHLDAVTPRPRPDTKAKSARAG
jgi:hypothetical protein